MLEGVAPLPAAPMVVAGRGVCGDDEEEAAAGVHLMRDHGCAGEVGMQGGQLRRILWKFGTEHEGQVLVALNPAALANSWEREATPRDSLRIREDPRRHAQAIEEQRVLLDVLGQ